MLDAKRFLIHAAACLFTIIVLDSDSAQSLSFQYTVLDNSYSGHREVGDINGDGFNDIVAVNESGSVARIVWYRYSTWNKTVLCEIGNEPDFHAYRADDLELGDLDGDGDLDVVGRIGIEENDPDGINVWFENPRPQGDSAEDVWKRHNIGASEYVKDIEIADFNGDQKLDVVSRVHTHLYVWLQVNPDSWTKVTVDVPQKEGMEVADLDRDGDPDVVLGGSWFETPSDPLHGEWPQHIIDAKWFNQNTNDWRDNCCKVAIADLNRDGCLDVLFSSSEKPGYPISWYQAPPDPKTGAWQEHVIGQIDYCHNLKAADFDNDGDLDVFAAEMPRYDAPYPVVVFLNQGDALQWQSQTLAETGNYSAQIGDLGNDGDTDIIGLRRWDQTPMELWINQVSGQKLSLDKWTYIQVDNNRAKWGDFDAPDWLKYFGVDMGDIDGDGDQDIVSGRYFYRNPGGDMAAPWPRIDFGLNVDAIFTLDVDGDEQGDVIAQALPDVYWLEAKDKPGESWNAAKIGNIPKTDHVNSQGFAVAQIIPGGQPELLIAANDGIYCFHPPWRTETTSSGNWPCTRLTKETSSEGIGFGDFDRDGYIDITAASEKQDYFAWWKNPGDGSGDWKMFKIGKTPHDGDRFAVADYNGDGRLDIAISEERYPGPDPDANLLWYEQPADPTQPNWPVHVIVTEYSLNNLDTADLDHDGDPDLVTCEHKGPVDSQRLQIWENDGKGNFTVHQAGVGHESHLGTQLADLDGDSDLDIVSIAWDNYKFLHVWRNNAIQKN